MIRKLALAIVAASTVAIGALATADDASAYHRRGGVYVYLGGGHNGYYGGHRHYHCHWKRVKSYGYWKRVKRCHGHRHHGGHH